MILEIKIELRFHKIQNCSREPFPLYILQQHFDRLTSLYYTYHNTILPKLRGRNLKTLPGIF